MVTEVSGVIMISPLGIVVEEAERVGLVLCYHLIADSEPKLHRAQAIRAEAKGSRVKHRKLLLRISQRPEFQQALDAVSRLAAVTSWACSRLLQTARDDLPLEASARADWLSLDCASCTAGAVHSAAALPAGRPHKAAHRRFA